MEARNYIAMETGEFRILNTNFMDVIYYYCFLFNVKIIKDNEPYATTVWALGLAEGYFLTVVCDIVSMRYFCFDIIEYFMTPIIGITIISNYIFFNKSKRSRRIIKDKPTFFGSDKISMILTIIFFVVLISSMFWGAICSKYLLQNYCN